MARPQTYFPTVFQARNRLELQVNANEESPRFPSWPPHHSRRICRPLPHVSNVSADIALSSHQYPHYRLGGAVILSVMYAHDVAPKDDYLVYLADTSATQLTENIFPNSTLFFAFPGIFRHIPTWFQGAGFKRLALEARKVAYKMRDLPLAAVQKQMVCRVPMTLTLVSKFNLFHCRKRD